MHADDRLGAIFIAQLYYIHLLYFVHEQKTKIREVKLQIKEKTGIEPEHQRLIYGNKPLEDDQPLEAYPPMQNGSSLHLVLRLPGGGNLESNQSAQILQAQTSMIRSTQQLFVADDRAHSDSDEYHEDSTEPEDDTECSVDIDLSHLQLSQSHSRNIDPALPRSSEPCVITQEAGPDIPVLQMPCGHSISPDGLLDYCWSEIRDVKPEIRCPLCATEWSMSIIKQYGGASDTELHELEKGLSRNYCLKNDNFLECPGCNTFFERENPSDICINCIVCTKKKGSRFYFCWHCLKPWKNTLTAKNCGNQECNDVEVMLRQLQEAPMITTLGLNISVPKLRACPGCGAVIEHIYGCKQMTCKNCQTEFCFICLRKKNQGSWSCGSFDDVCAPAPRQTKIPRRNIK